MSTPERSHDRLSQLPPGAEAEPFDPDRLDVYLHRWAGAETPLYGGILALLALACAAIPIIQVPLSIRAEGHLRPIADAVRVVSPANGWARWVRASDQNQVAAGDTLLVLDPPAVDAAEAVLRARRKRLETEIGDLRTLLSQDDPARQLPLRSLRYEGERQRVQAELARLEDRLQAAIHEQWRASSLARRGLTPAAEVDRVAHRVRELEHEQKIVRSWAGSLWQGHLASAEVALELLHAEEVRLAQERRALAILAPATGDLDEGIPFAPGAFVTAGETVARVTPVSELVAELYVRPEELTSLRRGGPARLQLGSTGFAAWRMLDGRIYELAPYAARMGERAVAWVRVRFDPPAGMEAEDHLRLRRGLTVSARMPVGRRSLLDLLRTRAGPPRGAVGRSGQPEQGAR